MKVLRTLVYASLLVPALAWAQPKTADEWYKEGDTQYNLGNFDGAADAFKQGFALEQNDSKKPAYLYNVAQAYRQAHKCKDASFFYKRYLSLKDQDTAKPLADDKRKEIEGWIAELDKCADTEDSLAHKTPDSTIPNTTSHPTTTTTPTTTTKPTTTPPTNTAKPTTTANGGDNGNGNGDDDSNGSVTKSANGTGEANYQPSVIVVRVTGGAGKAKIGSVGVPIQGAVNLFAGYPLALGDQFELDLGVDAAYMPVPYDNTVTGAKSNAAFINALADVGFNYVGVKNLAVRVEVGAGILGFTGVDEMDTPFTKGGGAASGALGMFAVRAALGADYAFTQNLIGTITPIAYSYSPATSGLVGSSISRIDFMLGIGYRM